MTTTSITETVTQWRAKRAERLSLQKQVEDLEEEEKALKGQIISSFQSSPGEGVVVDGRVTGLKVKEQPIVGDRDKLVNYIFDNKDLSVLQFRLSTTAIAELKEGGVDVPGVEYIEQYDLYDRKI